MTLFNNAYFLEIQSVYKDIFAIHITTSRTARGICKGWWNRTRNWINACPIFDSYGFICIVKPADIFDPKQIIWNWTKEAKTVFIELFRILPMVDRL